MDFTKDFIKSKSPCAEGLRWYLRHHREGSDYQQVLDHLVRDGRVDDARWLLDKVGPSNTVLRLDALDCDAIVFAGTIEVRGGIEVGSVLRAGGAIRCGGALRAGALVQAGGDLKVASGLHCGGDLRCGGSLVCGAHVIVRGRIEAQELKSGGQVDCAGRLKVTGPVHARGDLLVGEDCSAGALVVKGPAEVAGSLRTARGLICEGAITCGMHVDAGWGIKAGADLVAAGAIRAGEGVAAEGAIRCGAGYGVFAGLAVQQQEWETSARVSAHRRPARLMSGFWAGASDAGDPVRDLDRTTEPEHAH